MSEKRNKPHVNIGTIRLVDYGKTSLNMAILETLNRNPNQIPHYDPIDHCVTSISANPNLVNMNADTHMEVLHFDCDLTLQEQWIPIRGYENLYEVSSFGNVKSIKRGILLKPYTHKNGYRSVSLWYKNKKKNKLIHRLVAEAFLPNPNNMEEVNHKDENKANNRLDNLEWCSHLYNMNYGHIKEKLSVSNKGKPSWSKGKKCPQISERQRGKKHLHKGHPGVGGRTRKR